MIFKRCLILILLVIFSSTTFACANRVDSESSSESTSEQTADMTNAETYKIIKMDGASLLLCKMTEEDTGGQLYTLNLDGCRITDKTGEEVSKDNLKNGMLIALVCSTITEMYPSGLMGVTSIQVGEQENDVVGFYLSVIQEVYSEDTALNADIEMISLDLTDVSNLTESEKSALEYQLSSIYPYEIRRNTNEELTEEGLIVDGNFEKGILIEISGQATSDHEIWFEISKFRSGVGADFYSGCTAAITGDTWEYSLGSYAVS